MRDHQDGRNVWEKDEEMGSLPYGAFSPCVEIASILVVDEVDGVVVAEYVRSRFRTARVE